MGKVLTQEYLKEILEYNPESGLFIWKVRKSRRSAIGSGAGTRSKKGYFSISIDSKVYRSHRLAWLYVYGKFPENGIDHINGNPSDNSIHNLRIASQQSNNKNVTTRCNNSSGYKGVSFDKNTGKWKAQAQVNGKKKHLGLFTTPEEASVVYNEYTKEHFKEFYRNTINKGK
jgi:hypothetical protein